MRFLIFLLIPFFMVGQETPEEKDRLFIALYTVGDSWDTSKSPGEQAYFKDHSNFLKKLRENETITLGARYGDTGMVVFKAVDIDAAKALVTSDLAIKNHLFNVEVHAYAPFYKGCIE